MKKQKSETEPQRWARQRNFTMARLKAFDYDIKRSIPSLLRDNETKKDLEELERIMSKIEKKLNGLDSYEKYKKWLKDHNCSWWVSRAERIYISKEK